MQKQKTNHLLLIVGTAWLFDAMDVALLSFIMPLIRGEWHLSESTLGGISAITSIGMIFGAVFAGRLADMIGRKHVLMGTLVLFSLGNLALIFAPNITVFMIIRFITGLGLGGELPVAATLLADNFSGTKRSQMLILGDSFWAYGWIIASLVAWLLMPIFGWRIAAIVTAVAGLYAFILRRHLPEEKPHDKTEHAAFSEIWHSSYRRQLIVLAVLWFIVMLTYYGMFMWLPSVLTMRGFSIVNSMGYTLLMSIAQLPGYYLAAYLMKRVARKTILAVYIGGTIVASVLFVSATSSVIILIAGAMLSFFDLGAWGTLIAITPSQFPQAIRGTGMGTAQSIGRVGAAIGPYLVGWLLDGQASIQLIFGIFIGLLIIALITLVAGLHDHSVEDYGAMAPAKGAMAHAAQH